MEHEPRQAPAEAGADMPRTPVSTLPRCPGCGWQNVRMSHSKGILDYALEMFSVFAFRCRSCGMRFYKLHRRSSTES
jgi:hypothetical protein